MHGLQRAGRVGPGDHQGLATATRLVGHRADVGAASVVAQHPEPGRDVGSERAVGLGDMVAVAEEREVAVGEPAQQRRHVGLRGDAGARRLACERVGDLAGAPAHRFGVRDDFPHLAQNPDELGFQVPWCDGERGQLQARPRFGQRVRWRRVGVGAGQHVGELAVGRTAHHHDRVQHPADLTARPRDGGQQRGDEERHVVGDDLDDQTSVGRLLHPDHRLTRGPMLRQRQMGPRGDLQLAPVATERTGEVRGVALVEGGERGQVGVGCGQGFRGPARHMQLRDRAVFVALRRQTTLTPRPARHPTRRNRLRWRGRPPTPRRGGRRGRVPRPRARRHRPRRRRAIRPSRHRSLPSAARGRHGLGRADDRARARDDRGPLGRGILALPVPTPSRSWEGAVRARLLLGADARFCRALGRRALAIRPPAPPAAARRDRHAPLDGNRWRVATTGPVEPLQQLGADRAVRVVHGRAEGGADGQHGFAGGSRAAKHGRQCAVHPVAGAGPILLGQDDGQRRPGVIESQPRSGRNLVREPLHDSAQQRGPRRHGLARAHQIHDHHAADDPRAGRIGDVAWGGHPSPTGWGPPAARPPDRRPTSRGAATSPAGRTPAVAVRRIVDDAWCCRITHGPGPVVAVAPDRRHRDGARLGVRSPAAHRPSARPPGRPSNWPRGSLLARRGLRPRRGRRRACRGRRAAVSGGRQAARPPTTGHQRATSRHVLSESRTAPRPGSGAPHARSSSASALANQPSRS